MNGFRWGYPPGHPNYVPSPNSPGDPRRSNSNNRTNGNANPSNAHTPFQVETDDPSATHSNSGSEFETDDTDSESDDGFSSSSSWSPVPIPPPLTPPTSWVPQLNNILPPAPPYEVFEPYAFSSTRSRPILHPPPDLPPPSPLGSDDPPLEEIPIPPPRGLPPGEAFDTPMGILYREEDTRPLRGPGAGGGFEYLFEGRGRREAARRCRIVTREEEAAEKERKRVTRERRERRRREREERERERERERLELERRQAEQEQEYEEDELEWEEDELEEEEGEELDEVRGGLSPRAGAARSSLPSADGDDDARAGQASPRAPAASTSATRAPAPPPTNHPPPLPAQPALPVVEYLRLPYLPAQPPPPPPRRHPEKWTSTRPARPPPPPTHPYHTPPAYRSPISRLPAELLSNILELALCLLDESTLFHSLPHELSFVRDCESKPNSFDVKLLRPIDPWPARPWARRVRLVSKRWNDVVLHTPRLWRHFTSGTPWGMRRQPGGLKNNQVLLRAGTVPVDVHIHFDRMLARALLNPGPGHLPFTLPPVTLAIPAWFAPRVRRLVLTDGDNPRHARAQHEVPWRAEWSNLQQLVLKGYTVDVCALVELMKHAPKLWSLTFELTRLCTCATARVRETGSIGFLGEHTCYAPAPPPPAEDEDEDEDEPEKPSFPQVKQLHLCRTAWCHAPILFDHMQLPELEHLTIIRGDQSHDLPPWGGNPPPLPPGQKTWHYNALSYVPLGTVSSVKHVAYYGQTLVHEEITALLRHTPKVEVLALGTKHGPFRERRLLHAFWIPSPAGTYLAPELHTMLMQNVSLEARSVDALVWWKREVAKKPLRMIALDQTSCVTCFEGYRMRDRQFWVMGGLSSWRGLEAWKEGDIWDHMV